MKKIFLVVVTFVLAISFTACGNSDDTSSSKDSNQESSEASITELSSDSSTGSSEGSQASEASENEKSELQTVLEKIKSEVKLPDDMVDFDARRLKRVFGITDEEAADFAGAICTDGLKQDQIIFVKAKDENTAKSIADKLQANWQSKYDVIKNYDASQIKIIESAKVEKDGLYVSLVISADADRINSIYKENIKTV